MKAKTIVCSLAIASMGFTSLAFAQPARHEERRDVREAQHNVRDARHDVRDARRDLHDARRDRREDRREEHYYYNARGPEFRRGGRLPPQLRQHQYVVSNWHAHRLSAPPRGYEWVQVGPDYVLAAIATGLIANLILGG